MKSLLHSMLCYATELQKLIKFQTRSQAFWSQHFFLPVLAEVTSGTSCTSQGSRHGLLLQNFTNCSLVRPHHSIKSLWQQRCYSPFHLNRMLCSFRNGLIYFSEYGFKHSLYIHTIITRSLYIQQNNYIPDWALKFTFSQNLSFFLLAIWHDMKIDWVKNI